MTNSAISIVDYEATCAAGVGLKALRASLADQRTGLQENNVPGSFLKTWVGSVDGLDEADWSNIGKEWQSRNNALIQLALAQGTFKKSLDRVKARFSPSRIGVVMGSSTSSIDRAETAYKDLIDDTHLKEEFKQEKVLNPHAPGLFVANQLDLSGPNMTINTACSSSAKVFASAARWLNVGLVDAVLVGGADTLCLSVLHGFHSLQLVSEHLCKPFDAERDGINLGEGAGFALLVREGELPDETGIVLSGYGESSDAHHMSHPHPEGLGAKHAIDQALALSGVSSGSLDYINLHGTASKANDHIEGNLIGQLFPESIASSTKAWMGHTLGAAGILESIIAFDSIKTGLLPGTLNLNQVDPEIAIRMSAENVTKDVQHVMSNSFGFGGNNACLVFSAR